MSDSESSPATTPPPQAASIRGGSVGSSEGDWTCADCGNINFARRSQCNRCSKGRAPIHQKKKKLGQEIGKQAAEKSRGLFSADDWQCNKCGNVNWARRQQCNVCNAPKFGEVEERTGFGGGYNDRGVVEYKEREDSDDDEYDEFGRRKKRRGDNGYQQEGPPKVIVKEAPKPPPKKVVVQEEDDEDEEDEDDDGDLSKYDLSDWGEVKAVARKSRSRSRSPIRKN